MADTYDNIPLGIMLDGDGALPLPTRPTYGSTRHVANSAVDLAQYTGVGSRTYAVALHQEADDFDDLVDIYEALPRVSNDLTINGSSIGDWFLESMTEPRKLLDGTIFVSVVFREDTS